MKVFNTVAKIVLALTAVAGAVYVVATYGDKIVAWAKKLLGRCNCSCDCVCDEGDCEAECKCTEAPCECTEECAEEAAEACTCACEAAEETEAPAEEVPADAVVAEESDFEG